MGFTLKSSSKESFNEYFYIYNFLLTHGQELQEDLFSAEVAPLVTEAVQREITNHVVFIFQVRVVQVVDQHHVGILREKRKLKHKCFPSSTTPSRFSEDAG